MRGGPFTSKAPLFLSRGIGRDVGRTNTELLRVELYRGLLRGDWMVASPSEALSRGRYEIDDCLRGLVRDLFVGETCFGGSIVLLAVSTR